MVISLAQGYEKALEIVALIVGSRMAAVNPVTDAVTYPMIPITTSVISITYFPRGGRHQYGDGVFSIATLWDIDLIHDNPIDAIL